MADVTSVRMVGSKMSRPRRAAFRQFHGGALGHGIGDVLLDFADGLGVDQRPWSVTPASPSPTRSLPTASVSFLANSSYTPACTRSRLAHTQV